LPRSKSPVPPSPGACYRGSAAPLVDGRFVDGCSRSPRSCRHGNRSLQVMRKRVVGAGRWAADELVRACQKMRRRLFALVGAWVEQRRNAAITKVEAAEGERRTEHELPRLGEPATVASRGPTEPATRTARQGGDRREGRNAGGRKAAGGTAGAECAGGLDDGSTPLPYRERAAPVSTACQGAWNPAPAPNDFRRGIPGSVEWCSGVARDQRQ